MSGSGMSGIEISGFGYFRVLDRRLKTSNGSCTEKVGFGRVREFPKFEKSGSGLSGIEKTRVRAGIFGFGNSRTHHYTLQSSCGKDCEAVVKVLFGPL